MNKFAFSTIAFLAAATSSCDTAPQKDSHATSIDNKKVVFDDEGQAMWNCATKAVNTLPHGIATYDADNRELNDDGELDYKVTANDETDYAGTNIVSYNVERNRIFFMSIGIKGKLDSRALSMDFNKDARIKDLSVRNLDATPEVRDKIDHQYSEMINSYITCLKPQG